MESKSYEVIPIIKSENDDREYKFIILNNKMKILLISDPTSEKSAASLNVNVGSASDPDSVPGIAHFCEHMLFLGTKKYPVEGEFHKFIGQNGGSFNAYTSSEHTNYFFDVKSETLAPSLDRFAQFFLSPLFDINATDRELHAVDAEHKKNILNDLWRKYYIDSSTSKHGHPFGKFGTGNLETLKTLPEENGIDVRQTLLDFHTKHYSANIITFAMLGSQTIDELEQISIPLFQDITNKEVDVLSCADYPYGEDELRVVIKIPTIKEIKRLEIKFLVPDYFQSHYNSQPWDYIANLIGHEGEGSLLSLLKEKLYANYLNCWYYRGLKGFGVISISIELTDEGLNSYLEIVELCFQYIKMLKAEPPQEWFYEELSKLKEIEFRFKSKERPQGYVTTMSSNMQMFPPKDVLYSHYRMDAFDPDIITKILDELNPSNVRCVIQSQTFEGKTDKIAKYYDAGYSIEKIPDECIEKWKNIPLHADLHLPKQNLFIPDSLDIAVPREENDIKSVPSLIKDNRLIRFWYKADDTFFLPKAYLKLHLLSPMATVTPSHQNHLTMFIMLLRDELVEFAYDAKLAGIKYHIGSSNPGGLVLEISGFNSKQLVLLSKILQFITKLEVKDDRFKVNKIKCEEWLKNMERDEPYVQVGQLKGYLIGETWTSDERLKFMDELTVESMKSYIPEYLKSFYIEALFCGNLSLSNVNEICSTVEKFLIVENHAKPLLPSQHWIPREYKIPKSSNFLYEKRSEIHSNSCVNVYFQVGVDETRSIVLNDMFSHMIRAPLFDKLRTKEQLGYIVFSGFAGSNSVSGFRVLIQSDKSPAIVHRKIEEFLKEYEETITEMSDEQFLDYVEGLVVKKLEKPKKLNTEAGEFWNEINSKQYHYRRSEVEVEELKKVTKDDILQFYRTYISPSSDKRKKITFTVLGKEAKGLAEDEDDKSWKVIDDVLQFKSSLSLYRRVMPYNGIPLLSKN